jgi:hypothetical protein
VALLAGRFCCAAHRIGDVAGNVDKDAATLTVSHMIGDLNRFCGDPITARKSGL